MTVYDDRDPQHIMTFVNWNQNCCMCEFDSALTEIKPEDCELLRRIEETEGEEADIVGQKGKRDLFIRS